MLTNEIISILINSLIFIIFISFQDTKSIPSIELIQTTTFDHFITISDHFLISSI